MYLKKLLAVALICVSLPLSTLQAQELTNILKEHYKAVGAEKLSNMTSVTTTGKLNQAGLDIPFKQIAMRPNMFRVEGTFQGLTFVQTFNGSEGWSLNPFAMSTDPEPVPADQLDDMKLQSDIDGMLWNWKAKGYSVTYEGEEDVEGTPCYKIRVETDTSNVFTEYLDQDSYMIIKSASKTNMMGVEVESETYYSNYIQVDGIAFPGKIENRYNGNTGEVITVDTVEFDLEYRGDLFDKPAK